MLSGRASIYGVWFIKDINYLIGDKALEFDRMTKLRKNNVEVLQSRYLSSPRGFCSYKSFIVQVLRNVPLLKKGSFTTVIRT